MLNKEIIRAEMSADITSDIVELPIDVAGTTVTFQASWPATDSPIGVFLFEVSNDYLRADPTAATWSDLSVTVVTNPAGTADSSFITLRWLAAKAIRMIYDRTSGGTGATLVVRANARAS